jgi:hypothetical protein
MHMSKWTCSSMYPHVSVWIHVGPCGSTWPCMLLWIHVDPHRSMWIHMDPCGSMWSCMLLWTHMDPHGFMWIHMDPCGSMWSCMLLWIHMDPHGSTWIHVDPCGLAPSCIHMESCGPTCAHNPGGLEMGSGSSHTGSQLFAFAKSHYGHCTLAACQCWAYRAHCWLLLAADYVGSARGALLCLLLPLADQRITSGSPESRTTYQTQRGPTASGYSWIQTRGVVYTHLLGTGWILGFS